MSGTHDVAELGASQLKDGVPVWEANVPVGGTDATDVEPFGQIDVMMGLGISTRPWPKDDGGFAEGVILRHCGGRIAVCVGARDARLTGILGRCTDGDTIVHTTGPGEIAQLQLKQIKRQAAIVVKDALKKTMAFVLDGLNRKAQLAVSGAMLQIDEDGEFSLVSKSGAALVSKSGRWHFLSAPVFHGTGIPPGFCLMAGPPTGSPGAAAAAPMLAVQGVGLG